ncbi:iron-containing alcohol dehydrogenase, partial [Escherichia sp. S69_ASV_4]|nr:iron-containing alcohol dehydrogenase [Escherichia sp. S69_ASV_4]
SRRQRQMCIRDRMDAAGLAWAIYDGVVPNPTITVVKEGLGVFQNSGADYLIAIGGGSPPVSYTHLTLPTRV